MGRLNKSSITQWMMILSSFWSVSDSLLSAKIIIPKKSAYLTKSISAVTTSLDSQGGSDEDEEESLSKVSDAEALLACYSFLKKRKRTNWTQMERRQLKKKAAPVHYFWEEPDEEEYLAEYDYTGEEGYGDDENDFDDEFEKRPEKNDKDEIWYGEFTSFPMEASKTRLRRSKAAKKTWSDPEFRKRWHEKRWGRQETRTKNYKNLTAEERVLESKVRSLPSNFLGSPELVSMTEDEIDYAIRSYTHSKKQRVTSLKKTLEERNALLEKPPKYDKPLPRDSLFQKNDKELQKAKRKRSEAAKIAWKTRLKNQKRKSKETPVRKSQNPFLPTCATPQDALVRVEDDVQRGTFPSVDDLKLIMEPSKLARRKDLLRKILADLFDLRGKCVPLDSDDPDSEKEFATQAAISDLGKFVIHLLETRSSMTSGEGVD